VKEQRIHEHMGSITYHPSEQHDTKGETMKDKRTALVTLLLLLGLAVGGVPVARAASLYLPLVLR